MKHSPFAEIAPRCGEIQPDRPPRAKSCRFSAKSDRCTGRTQGSDGLRRYELACMKFNTFARCTILRLPRSCGVVEKSDPIARFSVPDRRKSWKIDGFHRISRRLDTIEPNKKRGVQQMYRRVGCQLCSSWACVSDKWWGRQISSDDAETALSHLFFF